MIPTKFSDRFPLSYAVGLSMLTGVLYGLASPKVHFHILCWILLVPLLWAIEDQPAKKVFYYGWIAGSSVHLFCFYWVTGTIQRYSNLNTPLSILALVLFCLYSGLPFGIITTLTSLTRSRTRLPMIILVPALYTTMEYLYPFIFPWHVGAGQYEVIPVIQIADLFGVYGVSTLIITVNCAIFQASRSLVRRTAVPWLSLSWAAVLLVATIVYGVWRVDVIESLLSEVDPLKVGIVQPNVLLEERSSPFLAQDIARRYATLSEKASNEGANLVVWPESAVNYVFQPQGSPYTPSGELKNFVKGLQTALIFGSISVGPDGMRNTAYLISPEGKTVGRYDKIHLLAFGEYMPFSNWIPQLNGLVQGVGDFKPGDNIDPVCWDHTCFGVLICYEAILKGLAREMTKSGAQFLVNITNDAWFGDTSCPEQHLMLASFRSVENRVYLVRSANTGISALVDPIGRIYGRTQLFTEALRVESIRPARIPTLYQKWGDCLPRLCTLITLVAIGMASISKWMERK